MCCPHRATEVELHINAFADIFDPLVHVAEDALILRGPNPDQIEIGRRHSLPFRSRSAPYAVGGTAQRRDDHGSKIPELDPLTSSFSTHLVERLIQAE